jgi:sulfur-oxidizing protein SoxZ
VRKDKEGNPFRARSSTSSPASSNGAAVFECDLDPAVSANPYFEFNAKVNESGTFKFTWVDDDGSVYEAEAKIEVK